MNTICTDWQPVIFVMHYIIIHILCTVHTHQSVKWIIPFADKVSILATKMTGKRDASDSEHVLHNLSLNSNVVCQ